MKKKSELPKVVYVFQEENRDHSTDLLVCDKLSDRGEGKVGIYDLREIVETRYEPQCKKAGTKTWFPIAE